MIRRAVITGAFSYTGAAVARELVSRRWTVHTLTNRQRPPGSEHITAAPLRFETAHLKREIEGADALLNTYWIRLPWGGQNFGTAVERSKLLIRAAVDTRVPRLVHLSVSNAAAGTNLGYYRGKAQVEDFVRSCGVSRAIVRPTLIVGPNDVLTNNIAWFLRRFPVFPMPRGGRCRLQPITLDDTARIIADKMESSDEAEVDAAGPDVLTFRDYVHLVARACGVRRLLPGTPNWAALGALRVFERIFGDIVLTREELLGLEQELLLSHEPALGRDSVSGWLMNHGETLGRQYIHDIDRHFGAGATSPVLNPGHDSLSSAEAQRND